MRPRAWASRASATRRYGSRSRPVVQNPPHSGTTVTATGVADSSRPQPRPRPPRHPDADDLADAEHTAEDIGGEPTDHPAGQVLGAGDRRREMDGVETIAPSQGVGRRAFGRRPVDDPDLDDALGARSLEQPRHLRPGDAELRRRSRSGSHRARSTAGWLGRAGRNRSLHRCAVQMCMHVAAIIGRTESCVNESAARPSVATVMARRRVPVDDRLDVPRDRASPVAPAGVAPNPATSVRAADLAQRAPGDCNGRRDPDSRRSTASRTAT